MVSFWRIFLFVPPILLFCFPVFSQLKGKIEFLSGSNTYQVSVIPMTNWSPPQSATGSAQITLKAPSGQLSVVELQSLMGEWSQQDPIFSPLEAPAYDYISFSLNQPVINQTYTFGEPVILFSFKNSQGCTKIEIVDNQNDPFLPPNSINVNIGNAFSILGAGIGQNAYAGNSEQAVAECPPLALTSTALQNPVACHNNLTSIVLQAVNGESPYQINWENLSSGAPGTVQIGTFEGQVVLENMPPGTYAFRIEDALGYLGNDTLQILNPPALSVELQSFDASCNGSLDGSVYVNEVHGGTIANAYQYYWETNPSVSSSSAGFLDPGMYSVTVVDDNGCSITDSVEVSTFLVIHLNPIVVNISCNGAANGIIDLYPVGNNAPFTYQWSSNVTTGAYSSAWKLGPGAYSVTVTDATGVCTQTGEYTIEEPPAIAVEYEYDGPGCYGKNAFLSLTNVENTIGDWKAEATGAIDLGTGREFEIEPGKKLTLTIRDSKGCEFSEEFAVPAVKELLLDMGDDYLIKYGEQITLQPFYYPRDNVNFEWTPTDHLSCSNCPTPAAAPPKDQQYKLVITDTMGCKAAGFVMVRVFKSREIYIPNAFSPNHDGINDVFYPFAGFEVASIQEMKIFDRWGNLAFKADEPFPPNDYQFGWNGSVRDKPASAGTYLYMLKAKFIDGGMALFSGEVTLMR